MKNNKNVSSFNRNTTSTVTAIFLVCLSNAESHPVTELLITAELNKKDIDLKKLIHCKIVRYKLLKTWILT